MKKLAILLAWDNFSEYHSRQLATAIAGEWDTTVTYEVLNWDEFDLVMPFFSHRQVNADCKKIIRPLWEPHEFGFASGAETVIAPSQAVYNRLKDNGWSRLVHLPWGINTSDFAPQPFPPAYPLRVGWCGLPMLERKQYDRLADVIDSISGVDFLPNLCATTSGKTHGPYEMHDMWQYYARIHIYVCASVYEGFGFPLLEASACGRPVITFDVGCARDLEQSEAGILIVQSFDEMITTIANGIDYQLYGQESRDAVISRWSWDVMGPRWLEMLDEAYQYSEG